MHSLLRRVIAVGIATLCVAVAPLATFGAPAQPDFDAIAARAFAQGKVPGMAVAIVRDGSIVFEAGYGDANIAKKTPVTPQTIFSIGSISKQFTAACVLLLAERGKLSLDDPLAKYVPSLPNAKTITLRQALWQVSGLHNYPFPDRDWPESGPVDPAKIFALLATDPPDFAPGTKWEYSNTNYSALARAVEIASGMPYGRFLEKNIFKPLGMNDSGYGYAAQSTLPLATAYTGKAPFATYPSTMSLDLTYGAGGVVSSAHDMALWLDGLMQKRVLDAAGLAQMWTAGHLANGDAIEYGMGFIPASVNEHREVWHNGFAPGAGGYCYDAIFPDDRIGIVILTNADMAAATGVPETLTRELFEAMVPPVAAQTANPAVLAQAQTYWSQMAAGKIDLTGLTPEFAANFTPAFQAKLAAGIAALGSPTWTYLGSYPDTHQMTRYEFRLAFASGPHTFDLWLDPKGKIAGSLLKP